MSNLKFAIEELEKALKECPPERLEEINKMHQKYLKANLDPNMTREQLEAAIADLPDES
jgi:hypothetical protein